MLTLTLIFDLVLAARVMNSVRDSLSSDDAHVSEVSLNYSELSRHLVLTLTLIFDLKRFNIS